MPPIIRTARADEDLIYIWTNVASDNPGAADRILDAIERRWQQLAKHPQSEMSREDIAPGIRHLIVGQYLTLYWLSGDRVKIVRVLHGRRKMQREVIA